MQIQRQPNHEQFIQMYLRKSPEEREAQLLRILENIQVIAATYGSRTPLDEVGAARQRRAAIDTIYNIAVAAQYGNDITD